MAVDALQAFASHTLERLGAPEPIAQRVARSLVEADRCGHSSHGVVRLLQYEGHITQRRLEPAAEPSVVAATTTSAHVDANRSFGQITAALAIQTAVSLARESGVAVVAASDCNHVGRLGEWTELAATHQMIAFSWVGGSRARLMAPFGGAKGIMGTNPISIGFPRNGAPIVLDFATSEIAEGKVRLALEENAALPAGAVQDSNGELTIAPEDLYAGGAIRPFGGHKGYGLAIAAEILATALTGANAASATSGFTTIAVRADIFSPFNVYAAQLENIVRRMKSVPPRQGFSEVMLPGEPEARARAGSTNAVRVTAGVVIQLRELARRTGVSSALLDWKSEAPGLHDH